MAGPGGWRDKEVTDLGHLPVSRGRPVAPEVLSSAGSEYRGRGGTSASWLGQDFDGIAGAGGDPRNGLSEKAPLGTGTCQTHGKAKGQGWGRVERGENWVALGWNGP